ncbi:MAG: hypothetical protein RKE49_11060 [Oceanicaulis sp.]
MVVISALGGFLILCGALFLLAGLAPGLPVLARVRDRLELTGAFERGAAIVSGVLFIASGGAVSLGLEHLR